MNLREALAATPLFRSLADPAQEELAGIAGLRRFRRGAFVWREGDAADGLYLLIEGRLRVFRGSPDGRELLLHDHVAGDTLGEPGLFIAGGRRFTECAAVEASACARVSRAAMLDFYRRHPHAMGPMLERISGMLRMRLDTALDVAYSNVESRLARMLLHLADLRGQASANGVTIGVRTTQGTLAGLIGASRERVNQALRRFTERGWVRSAGSLLVLASPKALQAQVDGFADDERWTFLGAPRSSIARRVAAPRAPGSRRKRSKAPRS